MRIHITIILALVVQCSRLQAQSDDAIFKPSNPPPMKPITSRHTPAYREAKLFLRGANLGNYLEVPPGQNWRVTVAADEFAQMRHEGFDHVRVPIGWHQFDQYNTLPTGRNPSSPLAFAAKLNYVHEWSEAYGRPVHIGEFGAYTKADEQSRANFYSAFRRTAEQEKLGWCIWDWSAGFRYWDQAHHRSMPGMHEALFGD